MDIQNGILLCFMFYIKIKINTTTEYYESMFKMLAFILVNNCVSKLYGRLIKGHQAR